MILIVDTTSRKKYSGRKSRRSDGNGVAGHKLVQQNRGNAFSVNPDAATRKLIAHGKGSSSQQHGRILSVAQGNIGRTLRIQISSC